jgi:hypothetical protein
MVRLPEYSQGTPGYSRGTHGPCVERSARGTGRGRARHSQRGRAEHKHARGYCKRYRVRPRRWATAGGGCQRTCGHVRRGYAHGRATVRAGARSGAYGHQRASARTHAHGAASRARRAHRPVSLLSADSAAGIVPSSELLRNILRGRPSAPKTHRVRAREGVPAKGTAEYPTALGHWVLEGY